MRTITRRRILQVAAAAVVSQESEPHAEALMEPTRNGGAPASETLYSHRAIEVYTDALSVLPGEELSIHVSTTARHFTLQIARVEAEEVLVWSRENIRGVFHPTPDDAWKNGCRWPVSVRLHVPRSWKSGYYQIKAITADAGVVSTEFLAFVAVRAASATSKILLVLSTNTYAAYNNYGGANLYFKKSTGQSTGLSGTTGEHKVSFQRPWMPGFLWKPENYSQDLEVSDANRFEFADNIYEDKINGIGGCSVAAGFHNWERVMVRWLARNGYTVDYAISSDLERHPELLGRYRLMLSVGHDEYWSWGMRDTVEAFVAQGGNVCFFSGNIAGWQVRFDDQGASMVCYKDAYREDPCFGSGHRQLATGYWSSHYIDRPEFQMTGLSSWYGGFSRFRGVVPQGPGGYLVYRPDHWVFKDTGMNYGDCLGQASIIVHYETDGCPIRMENGLPFPASDYNGPASLEILGMIPASFGKEPIAELAREIFGDSNPKAVERVSANRNHAVMSVYSNNGTVFCAGTTDWTSGLTGRDPAVERVTRNLIDRLSA